ncbi:hypothetical protein VTK26DRAFT_6344 [Humicola hyalothermophila]
MADEQLLDKIHSLSDLELAALLCLIAREHCLISTEPDSVDELAEELRLIASKTFNLSSAIVNCHTHTTLDEFATALLLPPLARAPPSPANTRSVSPYRPRHEQLQSAPGGPSSAPGSYFPSFPSPRIGGPMTPPSPSIGTGGHSSQPSQQPRIANVILAKDLDRAPRAVQIQALELLRTRRIFTRTSVQTAPKQFLFIALVGANSGGQARVTPHLNDFFYLGHWHDPEEHGFPHLDEELGRIGHDGANDDDDDDDDNDDDGASTTSRRSVVKRHPSPSATFRSHPADPGSSNNNNNSNSNNNNNYYNNPPTPTPLISPSEITHLSLLASPPHTHTSVSVLRYQHDLAAFLRTHRLVRGGVSPLATQHLARLAQSLAPLHGLDHVTPALVALAARKVYLHRVRLIARGEEERSTQWGGDPAVVEEEMLAAAAAAEGGVEGVIEEVIGMVAVPG